jgi:hypothetical protein
MQAAQGLDVAGSGRRSIDDARQQRPAQDVPSAATLQQVIDRTAQEVIER